MYEVKENSRILKDGTEITTYNRDVVSCNMLEVEAGTTGYCGGDTGHGGCTYFRIQDAACTDMEIHSYAAAHPLCEMCLENGVYTPNEQIHHVKPLSQGGTHDRENLMALCKSCHAKIHAEHGDRWHNR